MLALGYNQLGLGILFLQKCVGSPVTFTETKAWPWHWWENISETLWFFEHFDKVNLKKKEGEPKDHDHPTQSYILFGVLSLWCLVRFLVFCFTFSKMFSFNAGATRVDFSIYPHGHPRYNGEKMGSCFHFFKPRKKNEHLGSMFVTCACPGL